MDEKTPAIIRPKPALEIRLTPAGSEKSVRPTDSPSDRDKSSFDRDKPSFSKPRRPDVTPPKPWIELEEAQNQGGEVFHLGDLIEVRAPWGDVAKYLRAVCGPVLSPPKNGRTGHGKADQFGQNS